MKGLKHWRIITEATEEQNYIIKTDGTLVEMSKPDNGTDYTLEELQSIVDGYIEVINLDDKRIMIVNEEGKYRFNRNQKATELAHSKRAIFANDYIVGNAIVMNNELLK